MTVRAGDEIPAYELVVEAAPMKAMAALLADPNPIHWDTRAVAALGLGERPVNQGPLNMGYVQTMLARWAGARERVVDFRVRFLGNVLAGDRVRATGTVTELRWEPAGRVADCAVRLDVLDGGPVLEGTATVRCPEEVES